MESEGLSWVANTLPPTCPASLGHSRAKSDRDLAEPRDVCLECLCFRVLAAMGEVLTEWVAGGVPPWGLSMEFEPSWPFWLQNFRDGGHFELS